MKKVFFLVLLFAAPHAIHAQKIFNNTFCQIDVYIECYDQNCNLISSTPYANIPGFGNSISYAPCPPGSSITANVRFSAPCTQNSVVVGSNPNCLGLPFVGQFNSNGCNCTNSGNPAVIRFVGTDVIVDP